MNPVIPPAVGPGPLQRYFADIFSRLLNLERKTNPIWVTYTPGMSGGSIGSGSSQGRYFQNGKIVHFEATYTLGAGFNLVSALFTLPIGSNYVNSYATNIQAVLVDVGTVAHTAVVTQFGGSVALYFLSTFGSSTGAFSAVNNSSPFAWSVGDTINIAGSYEAA